MKNSIYLFVTIFISLIVITLANTYLSNATRNDSDIHVPPYERDPIIRTSSNQYIYPSHFSYLSKEDLDKNTDAFTFVAIGHIYNLATSNRPAYLDIYKKIIEQTNRLNPEVVFLLGDLTWNRDEWEWTILKKLLIEELNAPVIIAAGNHEFAPKNDENGVKWWETDDTEDQYHKEVPYLHTQFSVKEGNIITLATPDIPSRTINFLKSALKNRNPNKPTLVFTHNYIEGSEWQRRLNIRPEKGKPYFFEGMIDYLIGGDHNKQFTMRDDCFGGIGITCYAVGMEGQDKPYDLYFAYGELNGSGSLKMRPITIPLNNRHPIFGGSRQKEEE